MAFGGVRGRLFSSFSCFRIRCCVFFVIFFCLFSCFIWLPFFIFIGLFVCPFILPFVYILSSTFLNFYLDTFVLNFIVLARRFVLLVSCVSWRVSLRTYAVISEENKP